MNKYGIQAILPGMPAPVPTRPKKPGTKEQVARLERRILKLEVEMDLLKTQILCG